MRTRLHRAAQACYARRMTTDSTTRNREDKAQTVKVWRYRDGSVREKRIECACGWRSEAFGGYYASVEFATLAQRQAAGHLHAHEHNDGFWSPVFGWVAWEKVTA